MTVAHHRASPKGRATKGDQYWFTQRLRALVSYVEQAVIEGFPDLVEPPAVDADWGGRSNTPATASERPPESDPNDRAAIPCARRLCEDNRTEESGAGADP